MQNMHLNPGGLIGGLAGLGVGSCIVYLQGNVEGRFAKLIIACVTGGAVAGNYLWGLIFPKPAVTPEPETKPEPASMDAQ